MIGTAHYNEIFDAASCAGAPVRHPVTGRVEGVVSLTCRAEAANPLQLPLISAAARDIERRLLDAASATERRLLAAFTAARHRTTRPVLCVARDLVLGDAGRRPHARRRVAGPAVGARPRRRRRRRRAAVRADDRRRGGAARPLPRGARRGGDGRRDRRDRPAAARPAAPGAATTTLAGRSAAWRAAVAAVADCVATGTPVVVWGEPGVGKRALLADLGAGGGATAPDRPRPSGSAPAPSSCRRCAPAPRTSARSRQRSSARSAGSAPRRCSLARAPALARQRPRARDHAARDPRAAIGVDDLPAELPGAQAARVPTSGFQRLEAEAISRALAGCGGNKLEAARVLGISRSTLYRKLRAYGLDLERRAF